MSMKRNKLTTPFGYTVGITARAFKKRLDDYLTDSGADITADQFITLMNLRFQDGLCQQAVADLLGCDKTKTTRIIDGLQQRQLVTRKQDDMDRRQKMIHLTAKGRTTCRRLETVGWMTQKEALQGIPETQLKTCREVLEQVLNNLNRR